MSAVVLPDDRAGQSERDGKQAGPTRYEPELDRGLRDRYRDEVGACGFHWGPGNVHSHLEAGYLAATDLQCLRSTPPLQARDGPYMV